MNQNLFTIPEVELKAYPKVEIQVLQYKRGLSVFYLKYSTLNSTRYYYNHEECITLLFLLLFLYIKCKFEKYKPVSHLQEFTN